MEPIDLHMLFSMGMIVLAIWLYASEKISMELTSLLLIVCLLLFFHFFPYYNQTTQTLINTEKLLLGFANPALLGVLSLLVLGQAIVQTGALNLLVQFFGYLGSKSPLLAVVIALLLVLVVSGFLNNTPVVVIFIPIMAALAKEFKLSTSRVMMPLSFASILGGMTTLIGSSTNLLVSGILIELGYESLGFFDFSVPGMVLAGVGLVYILLVMPFLLKDRDTMVHDFAGDEADSHFAVQIEVHYNSDLVGKRLIDGKFEGEEEVDIRMLQRGEHAFLAPFDNALTIYPGDIIILSAKKQDIKEFFVRHPQSLEKHYASFDAQLDDDGDITKDMCFAEIVVAPNARVIGKTLAGSRFHEAFDCVVMGLQRGAKMMRSKVSDMKLAAGDVLLVMGARDKVLELGDNNEFLLMEWSTEELRTGRKAKIALAIFAGVVGSAALGVMPITVAALAGVALVLFTNCLNLRQAGRSIDMNIILLIGASLALGTALQGTGGADFIAKGLITLMHGAPVIVILMAFFLVMICLTNVLSNNASAVLFTPIALSTALQLGVDPKLFIFAVIFACNCSFVTPIGYQTNLMVMGPGHYKFADFMRAGIPLAIILWLTYIAYAYLFML